MAKIKKNQIEELFSSVDIENEYLVIDDMLTDQGNQTTSALQYVDDATDDPSSPPGAYAYYEKLATNTADLTDYRKLSDEEVEDLEAGIQRVRDTYGSDFEATLDVRYQSDFRADKQKDASYSVQLWVKEVADTGSVLDLRNIVGIYCNMASPNATTVYTVSFYKTGGFSRVLVNAPTEPTVDDVLAEQIFGSSFAPNTDMYLVVWYNGAKLEYWFEQIIL